LELGAVVPEADDHTAGVEAAERFEQQVDAFVVEELPEVEDRRLVGLEELRETAGIALVWKTLVSPARRIEASLVDQRGQRLLTRLGAELVHVDPRRDLVDEIDVANHLLEHLADVLGSDEDWLGPRKRLPRPGGELLVAADRVLELRSVSLHREARSRRGRHGPAEQDVVREHE